MKEQVFFIINEQELVLDKVLVEFDETPIFFVCKCIQDYYISFCANLEEERYIITRMSLNQLSKMLHGKITMRESILQANKFWDVVIGEDAGEDIVVEKSMQEIPVDALPYEGAYLKIATRDLETYRETIDADLYGVEGWENKTIPGYTEYIDEIVQSLDNQYEIIIQCICEKVIKDMKVLMQSGFSDGEYSEEVCNSKVQIHKGNTKADIKFMNSKGFSFAA